MPLFWTLLLTLLQLTWQPLVGSGALSWGSCGESEAACCCVEPDQVPGPDSCCGEVPLPEEEPPGQDECGCEVLPETPREGSQGWTSLAPDLAYGQPAEEVRLSWAPRNAERAGRSVIFRPPRYTRALWSRVCAYRL